MDLRRGGTVLAAAAPVGCSGTTQPFGSDDIGSLVGTWVLLSIDDTFADPNDLRWIFSAGILTVRYNNGACLETRSYGATRNLVTGSTISISDAEECAATPGAPFSFTYSLGDNTLTAEVTVSPTVTGTHLFRRLGT